jgi:hypothetical protein
VSYMYGYKMPHRLNSAYVVELPPSGYCNYASPSYARANPARAASSACHGRGR